MTCTADTIVDPFHQDQSTCSFSGSPLCDVIGTEANYDIQKASLVITGGVATVSLYFDSAAVTGSGSSMTLGSFSDAGLSLIVGDLFFYKPATINDPSDPGSNVQYAVPLDLGTISTPHPGPALVAGALYKVGTSDTALQALISQGSAATSDEYRPTETVLMTSGTLVSAGTGVTVANYGNGTTSAAYEVTVSFLTTADFMSLQNVAGQIGIMFSSADCSNDIIFGVTDTSVPEPQSMVLIAGGLGMLIGVGVWRRWATRKSRAV